MKEHKFTIGRSRKCDIVLADNTVSRHHAELIFLHNGHLLLIDCHSQNKTLIVENGQARRIAQEFLSPTDIVQFGSIRIPVKELLKAIRMKHPTWSHREIHHPVPEPPLLKPWPPDAQLVRCDCGGIKQKGHPCRECGQ